MHPRKLPTLVVAVLALFIVGTLTGLVAAIGFQLNPVALTFGIAVLLILAFRSGFKQGKKHHAAEKPTV